MISYEQAIDILESVGTLPRVAVSLDQALGRVCANDLISSIKVPPYRNSAMDGFAIHSNNGLDVEILTGQQSFRIKSFLTANCWAIIEENQLELDREDKVNIYPQTAGQWQF